MIDLNKEKVMLEFESVEVMGNERVANGVFELHLRAPKTAAKLKGGQFVHLRIPAAGTLLRRPLSVCQVSGDKLHILYAVVGVGTDVLTKVSVGDTSLDIIGPVGKCWPIYDEIKAPLLIGGGLGIAPLGKLAHEFRNQGVEVTLIQSAQTKGRLLTKDLHEHIARNVEFATDDGTFGHHGLVTDLIADAIASKTFDVAYICGPEPMQMAVSELTIAAGIKTYVSLERRMACGVGACLGCMAPVGDGLVRVCVDGPVFDAEEVRWDDAVSSRVH